MKNWISLNDEEYDKVWDRFCAKFNFYRENMGEYGRTFSEIKPCITFDISNQNEDDLENDEFENKILKSFIDCTEIDEYIYALDWQHESFWFNPRVGLPDKGWYIPFYPDGDYYFFAPKDFRWAYLTHPWEQTISIYGKEFIESFLRYKPISLNRIKRTSEHYISNR